MRKLLVSSFLFLCSLMLGAQTLSTQYKHINSSWNKPNTTLPDCGSATQTCLRDYTLTIKDPTGKSTDVQVALASGTTVSNSWTPGAFLNCGTYSVSVVANYYDTPNSVVTSSPVSTTTSVSCPITANPPSGLTASPAP